MKIAELSETLDKHWDKHPVRGHDDMSIADSLYIAIGFHGSQLLTTDKANYLYDKDRGIWREVGDKYLVMWCLDMHGATVQDNPRPLSLTHRRANAVVAALKTLRNIYSPDAFDNPLPGIAYRNGFLVRRSNGKLALIGHSTRHMCRSALDFDYSPEAGYSGWIRFLTAVFRDDADAAQKMILIGEFIGVCLLGHAADLQKCLLLCGQGANGKSVMLNVLRLLFPEDSQASIPPDEWAGHTTHVLDGPLVNMVEETPKKQWGKGETFKNIVTGGRLVANPKYLQPYAFRSRAGHVFAANDLPSTGGDTSRGMWRRFIAVGFNRSFENDDEQRPESEIMAELKDELPGISAWAIKLGSQALARGCYTIPNSHAGIMKDWETMNDSVSAWIDDGRLRICTDVEFACTGANSSSRLYRSYAEYCRDSGRHALNQTRFGVKLKQLQIPRRRSKHGCHYGLDLYPDDLGFQ